MKPSVRAKLESLAARLDELNGLLSSQHATRDLESFRRFSREHAGLTGLVGLYRRFQCAEADAQAARELAADPAMKSYDDDELKSARA